MLGVGLQQKIVTHPDRSHHVAVQIRYLMAEANNLPPTGRSKHEYDARSPNTAKNHHLFLSLEESREESRELQQERKQVFEFQREWKQPREQLERQEQGKEALVSVHCTR